MDCVADLRRNRIAKWAGIQSDGICATARTAVACTRLQMTGPKKSGEEEATGHQDAAAVEEKAG